jgi:hypothetical protein
MRHLIAVGAIASALAGCAQAGGSDAAKPRSAQGQLGFLQGDNVGWDTNVPRPGSTPAALQAGRSQALDDAVAGQCGLLPPAKAAPGAFVVPALLGTAIPVVAGWVIDYVVSQASAAAQKRLAEYSAVTAGGLQFGGQQRTGFYRSIDPPALAWRCVRLVHKIRQQDGEVVAMEAIVKVEVAPSQDSLLLTPLRLYFDRAVARTGSAQNSTFGVSLGMTFDALWQSTPNGKGETARVWNATVLSQKIDGINWKDDSPATTRQRFYYYNLGDGPAGRSDDSNKPVQVTLVPWSVNKKAPYGSGTLTATFAEVGDPPAVLEFVARILKDHGKDIGDFLKDAAKKAVTAEGSK